MTAGPLEVDEQLSWAQRVGDEIRVQLRLPGAGLEPGAADVRLTSGSRRIRLPAAVQAAEGAPVVTFSAPQVQLGSGVWSVAVRPSAGGQFLRARARLLAPPTQPVALLPGPAPETRMASPAPRARPSLARRLARRLPAPVRRALLRGRDRGPGSVERGPGSTGR
ncbi:MAG: hypothetical protein JWO11_253 [Nocardioides sp.]|nr:hypothetical protein [Nocardioides sp.]